MLFGARPMGSEFVDWKSTLPSVIPAEAGIQYFVLELISNLDAGFHRHDKSTIRLKAREFDRLRERL